MALGPKDRAAAEQSCPDYFRGRSRKKWVAAVEEYMNAHSVTVAEAADALKTVIYTPPVQRGNLTRS